MKAAEILRKLADIVDVAEPAPTQQPVVINIAGGGVTEPAQAQEPVEQPTDVMIPPLQQKIELMKHQAGVESVYDEPCDTCGQTPCECEDEVDILKRNAGIAVIQADEDEPFES